MQFDPSCELLIVINPSGATTVTKDPAVGPFDNIEDTLIGVQNNSAHTIASLPISGSNIFAFDGDGLCGAHGGPTPAGCPFGSTGYEGPNTSFTITDANNGVVNFTGGLAPGASTYFSLEEHVTPGSIEFALSVQANPISAVEAASFLGTVATFNDSDAPTDPKDVTANMSAVIDWGDGTTTPGTISGPDSNGDFTVNGTHTYADEGTYSTKVSVTDPDDPGGPAIGTGTANVADAALVALKTSVTGVEGKAISGATVATFTDANPTATTADFTATIDWGDGVTTAGTLTGPTGGPFAVSGNHTYAEEGAYTIKVSVNDDGGSTASTATPAAIADAALASITPATTHSTNPVDAVVAKFTDADPAGTVSDYSATINWGDGSPMTSGTVSGPNGGPFSVTGTHTYPSGGPFSYTVKVHICDVGGSCVDTLTTLLLLHMTGDAYAAKVTTSVVGTLTVAEAGPVDTTAASNTAASVVSLTGIVSGSVLGAGVITGVSPSQSSAQASAASLTVAPGPLPVIKVIAAKSSSQTSCSGSTGTSSITSLTIGGVLIASGSFSPNSTISVSTPLGPLTVILNEQTPVTGGLRVNAVHITGPLGLNVVVASATSDIHNCP